jgi:hypothetical protein
LNEHEYGPVVNEHTWRPLNDTVTVVTPAGAFTWSATGVARPTVRVVPAAGRPKPTVGAAGPGGAGVAETKTGVLTVALSSVAFTFAVPAFAELNDDVATGPVVDAVAGDTLPRSVAKPTGMPDGNTFPDGVLPAESVVRLAVIVDCWF